MTFHGGCQHGRGGVRRRLRFHLSSIFPINRHEPVGSESNECWSSANFRFFRNFQPTLISKLHSEIAAFSIKQMPTPKHPGRDLGKDNGRLPGSASLSVSHSDGEGRNAARPPIKLARPCWAINQADVRNLETDRRCTPNNRTYLLTGLKRKMRQNKEAKRNYLWCTPLPFPGYKLGRLSLRILSLFHISWAYSFKLLGVTVKSNWPFSEHFQDLRRTVAKRPNILPKVSNAAWGLERRILAVTTDALLESLLCCGLATVGKRGAAQKLRKN